MSIDLITGTKVEVRGHWHTQVEVVVAKIQEQVRSQARLSPMPQVRGEGWYQRGGQQ